MLSVPITKNVVSSNPAHGEVYSVQHYVISLSATCGGRWISPINEADRHDITEIESGIKHHNPNSQIF